ncbi:response regulator [Siccirubricoccus deserti]|uniref:Response regulator n=1 Tax=Siccirubricoccus deserti TaxID=2013562 RepID=A0A9X0UK02_9PROT|nr:response regulator [Siccirubricoccus deserti]MBC4018640.1 response regulator [Siccirubricoccus deserti]
MLIVEDEPLIRMLVCDLLEEAGFACTEAASGEAALRLLDQGRRRPNLLVTDFNLGPGLDGKMLAHEVQRRLPALPTAFVTGNPESFADYPFQPWEALLAKPFAGAELVAVVRALCADGRGTNQSPWMMPSRWDQTVHLRA